MKPHEIPIDTYNYQLPDEKIAKLPCQVRDESKLLVYGEDQISQCRFHQLPELLHAGDTVILNDTRVIPARLLLKKPTGGQIEVFCLEPQNSSHQDAMSARGETIWKCLVGGAKKWKSESVLSLELVIRNHEVSVICEKSGQLEDCFLIRFQWSPHEITFSEILDHAGQIPLPPYFNRPPGDEDAVRYQTVFARYEGSVAAPTAALHFTQRTFEDLRGKSVGVEYITLHVGAGTFKPVTSENLGGHAMHSEFFSVPIALLRKLTAGGGGRNIVVGTTTLRTLESLYWIGCHLIQGKFEGQQDLPTLGQWDAYNLNVDFSLRESLDAILNYCLKRGLTHFSASTAIMIAPGYRFKIADALITNFHMPKSTLMVLVSAFIGDDWKLVYDYALNNDFRFLSYGDSSILFKGSP